MSRPQTSPSVALTHLDRHDLTVLDLGLSYLLDAVRGDRDVLGSEAEHAALGELHSHVLALKVKADTPPPRLRVTRQPVGPCGCECSSGGFCGGCGHAGCGGRR